MKDSYRSKSWQKAVTSKEWLVWGKATFHSGTTGSSKQIT